MGVWKLYFTYAQPCLTKLCFSSLFGTASYWFGGWEAHAISFCECFVYASSASVKEDNTDNEQEKRDEKGTSERENNELEAVSI